MKIKLNNVLKLMLMLLFVSSFAFAKGDYRNSSNEQQSLRKTDGSPSFARFNINRVSTFFKNDGLSDLNQNGNSGFIYPKLSNKAVFYESGFIWGGKVNGEIRVGGSTYRRGQVPGAILADGSAESPDAPHVRIYRVRRDYKTGNLDQEAADEGLTVDEIYNQYDLDWQQWPASSGAPYEDVDGNGSYDPAVDIPGQPGADQTIWFVANDLDPVTSQFLYGSLPMGIEMQATIFGYNQTGALGSMLFRKYLIVNESQNDFEDFYVCMWSDPDLGDATDDYTGCDTTLSLGYIYNGDADDATYGKTPAAGGFDFFQGPIVDGDAGDQAIFKGHVVPGKKNLGMSAFFFFINSDPVYSDPNLGEYAEGTLEMYNLFEGKIGTTGQPFTDPNTGSPTKLTLAGDPIAGTGWVDGQLHPPGDRRLGQVAGPFTMAAGDTQEVVVAQIAAGDEPGVDRLGALGLLKFYDKTAQLIYDNFFQVASAPLPPKVEVKELDQTILLDWSWDYDNVKATENNDNGGFTFQGYNVYQLPYATASLAEATRLATFDVIDGVAKITDEYFDRTSGVVGRKVIQFGSDSGIKRFLEINTDAFNGGLPLVNGTRYYFAVTAYNFNPDPQAVPNNIENPLNILTVVPHSTNPGDRLYAEVNEGLDVTHKAGSANATITAKVVDPTKLTGNDYEVYFDQQHYYLDSDGVWKKTSSPDAITKTGDVSPSSLSGTGVYAPGSTIDLQLTVDVQSPDFAYVDGVKITFPAGVSINSAVTFAGCANGNTEVPVIDGQSVTWGNDSRSTFGCFSGGEVLTVNIDAVALPLAIDYVIYDDGYGPAVDPSNVLADAQGTFTVTEIGYNFTTQNHWNVKNATTGEVVIEDQTVLVNTDLYAGNGPGGSTTSPFLGSNVGSDADPIADGLQIAVTAGSYVAPINYQSISITRAPGSNTVLTNASSSTTDGLDLSNYTIFGGTISSKAIDNFGVGSNEIDDLQQDYELRFTGVLDTSVVGGKTLITVASGGQMATVFRSQDGGFAWRPDNPTGADAPYLVRIPFEIWNISDPDNVYQINYVFRDRLQTSASDPFYAWNLENRVYGIAVNSPYDENLVIQVDDGPDANNAAATWVHVWYSTNYAVGDVVTVTYANPIQPGKDVYSFTAPNAPSSSVDLAKDDVKEINVFPNPYYGVNSEELNKYQRFVTFNHLPNNATLRIFNLAGQLVRTIDKNSESQFTRWDLLNNSGLPVASGLYIVYIDMPDLGTTKILKAAIIQEQQILDRF